MTVEELNQIRKDVDAAAQDDDDVRAWAMVGRSVGKLMAEVDRLSKVREALLCEYDEMAAKALNRPLTFDDILAFSKMARRLS